MKKATSIINEAAEKGIEESGIFFWYKSGIFCAKLQRLISRTLRDLNGWQTLPKSFNTAACPSQGSNFEPGTLVKLEETRAISFKQWQEGAFKLAAGEGSTEGGGVLGLGGLQKRKEVRKLVRDLKPFILCIQETKLQSCDAFLSSSLWGSSPHAFSYGPSVEASGGLLTVWDSSQVDMWSTKSCEHVLRCRGRFIQSGEEFMLANVYAPCDDGAKQELWDSLSVRIQALGRDRVCVCGDFNAIKQVEERRSSRGSQRSSDHIPFSHFIDNNNLVDLPLSGRKFTWFRGDGLSMSRLDRFLLSKEWCLTWPNCNQEAKMRGLSDHCPLVLSKNDKDWGPRPSRMLKCWKDVPGYNLFVREKWNTFQVEDWGGYVLKEKLKMMNAALKDWHKMHVQNVPSRIETLK
ncbi:cysteine-rich receptor-like protein kinase, partial [Trifolium pratense]